LATACMSWFMSGCIFMSFSHSYWRRQCGRRPIIS